MLTRKDHQIKKILILGPMPLSEDDLIHLLRQKTSKKLQLFYVDGGKKHAKLIKKWAPNLNALSLSFGDGDSAKGSLDIKKEDQNLSDLAFLFEVLKKQKISAEQIHLFGFLGPKSPKNRLDHLLANIGETYFFLKKLTLNKTCIFFEKEVLILSAGRHKISINSNFSIFVLEKAKIAISGKCLYKYRGALSPLSSLGLSNQGMGQITIDSNKPAMIIFINN